jgi:transposase
VDQCVVAAVRESRGQKNDQRDALALAEALRLGAVKRQVYKGQGAFSSLRYRAKAHRLLVVDAVRVMNRIKSLLRSRGVTVSGKTVYTPSGRKDWIPQLPEHARSAVELLYLELDALTPLRERAEHELIVEARKHREFRLVSSCPGLGPIRAAELLPIVVTPYRFANKRDFWSYCGLGIVTRSSSDWVRAPSGQWTKTAVQQTRGLNRNFNRTLKRIFKGAAITVIGRSEEDEPLYQHYQKLLDGGTKPNLARLTIARQLASIVLSLWRNQEEYDPKKRERKVTLAGA